MLSVHSLCSWPGLSIYLSVWLAGGSVSRSYLALTAGRADIPSAGWVNAPLRGPSGELVPASTRYEVLARSKEQDVCLLRLWPATGERSWWREVTGRRAFQHPFHVCLALCVPDLQVMLGSVAAGRKHQLRLHCAHQLQVPILGDVKHGTTRNKLHQILGEQLYCLASGQVDTKSPVRAQTSKLQSLGLQLHSHSISINTPDGKTVRVTAPVPSAMRGLIDNLKMLPQIHESNLEKL